MQDKKKPYLKKTLSFIGVLCLTLLLFEIILRITGFYNTVNEKRGGTYLQQYNQIIPTWYWMHNPHDSLRYYTSEFSFASVANNYGFRDQDFDTSAHPTSKRILVIGDSFVEGIGANANETWPHQLELLLNTQTNDSVIIYNCGVAGSDPFYEYVLLRDRLIHFHPDVIIISLNYSDVYEYIVRGGMERFLNNKTVRHNNSPWFENAYRHVHIVRFLFHFIFRYDYSLLSPDEHWKAYNTFITKASETLILANKLCTANGIQLLVVIHPYLSSNDRYLKDQKRLTKINDILKTNSIKTISLFDAFDKSTNKNNAYLYAWKEDKHFTAEGYRLFANILFGQINQEYPNFWNSSFRLKTEMVKH